MGEIVLALNKRFNLFTLQTLNQFLVLKIKPVTIDYQAITSSNFKLVMIINRMDLRKLRFCLNHNNLSNKKVKYQILMILQSNLIVSPTCKINWLRIDLSPHNLDLRYTKENGWGKKL